MLTGKRQDNVISHGDDPGLILGQPLKMCLIATDILDSNPLLLEDNNSWADKNESFIKDCNTF